MAQLPLPVLIEHVQHVCHVRLVRQGHHLEDEHPLEHLEHPPIFLGISK